MLGAQASNLFLKEETGNLNTNEQPVIGILSQTLEEEMKADPRFAGYASYVMSDVVKFMEAQGARVVPVVRGETDEVTKELLKHLDGVLFPGGDGDNYDLGKLVLDEIVKYNDAGHYYPAWGTCLGYENMVAYTADAGLASWGIFDLRKTPLPMTFVRNPADTKMYNGFG